MITKQEHLKTVGKSVIQTEAHAISALIDRIDKNFVNACDALLARKGHIIVIGMGKSGHIGNKLAATFASTGNPAFFVHPAEASHGDLGMITTNDIVIALSYSGRTKELLTILPLIKHLGVPLISITGDPSSPLAQSSNIHLNVHVEKEACPLGLAPTSSTTATLAMGDALAIALLETQGFTKEDFAYSHPAGNLGARLLLRIDSLMHTGDTIPCVRHDMMIANALLEITTKRLGLTTVINEYHELCGIYTDGDLRRTLNKGLPIHTTPIHTVMTKTFKSIPSHTLAIDALTLMETHKITALIVSNNAKHCEGIIHIHDLLSAGITSTL